MRPAATLRAHLTFHLKHEVPHFELMARLFARCDPAELASWVADEPTGQYARRAAFLFEFGTEPLLRFAVWMTLRESRSSFEIEGEADKTDRIRRFSDVLARRTGLGSDAPLDEPALAGLQREILGQRTTIRRFGLRQSPVFVGESARYQEIVHYVAPPQEDLAAMLEGLQVFLDRTRGQSPLMRSAVAAFGFVYLHPLADGNGRLHRFLINDVLLRRDGVVRDPMILPVSSLLTSDVAERRAYDRILEPERFRGQVVCGEGGLDLGNRRVTQQCVSLGNPLQQGIGHREFEWREIEGAQSLAVRRYRGGCRRDLGRMRWNG
jgi:hypothetical protein